MIHVTTISGSRYEFDRDNTRFRRVNAGAQKRGDGEWLDYLHISQIAPGQPILIVLESLAHLGPDDHGTIEPDTEYTTRITSSVVKVKEDLK